MTTHARGTFEVTLTPQAPDDYGGAPVGRISIAKQFHGDLSATSSGQMLSVGQVGGSWKRIGPSFSSRPIAHIHITWAPSHRSTEVPPPV